MVTLAAIRVASVIKCIGVLGAEPDCFGVIGNSAIEFAMAGVSIATMHEAGGVSRIGSDRLVMIRDGFLVLAHALPLVAAIAVDDFQIVPIVSARANGARASVDCGAAGPSYTCLAIVGCCSANEANGGNADWDAAN